MAICILQEIKLNFHGNILLNILWDFENVEKMFIFIENVRFRVLRA